VVLEQETAISQSKHHIHLVMHFKPGLVSNFPSFKRQTSSNAVSAVSWQVGFALPPCVYFPCTIQLQETRIILPTKSQNTHTSSTSKSSLLSAGVGGGCHREKTGRMAVGSYSRHMINTVSYLPELDLTAYRNKVSKEALSSRVTSRHVFTGFPNNTPRLKATTKDLQRCLTSLHNAELRPGFFCCVCFYSVILHS